MATFREQQARRGSRSWTRTRWIVLAGVVLAAIVLVVLLLVSMGGGGGGGGGY